MKTVDFLLNFKAKTDAVTRATSQMEQNIDKVEKKASGFASTFKGMLGANLATTAITTALSAVTDFVKGSTEAWNVQALAEKKLETVMRQRMGATDAAIDSVKTLASAQQQLGVIGDEVQLSGAQQMATFLNEKKSLDVLMPAMNNLLAQQKGFNATQEDAVGIGNLIGKVMQGQTAALTRVGVTFTAAQEQVLKYGNEQQRAAMLAQVITDNVGNMNEALAATPEGKLKQLQNDYGPSGTGGQADDRHQVGIRSARCSSRRSIQQADAVCGEDCEAAHRGHPSGRGVSATVEGHAREPLRSRHAVHSDIEG